MTARQSLTSRSNQSILQRELKLQGSFSNLGRSKKQNFWLTLPNTTLTRIIDIGTQTSSIVQFETSSLRLQFYNHRNLIHRSPLLKHFIFSIVTKPVIFNLFFALYYQDRNLESRTFSFKPSNLNHHPLLSIRHLLPPDS